MYARLMIGNIQAGRITDTHVEFCIKRHRGYALPIPHSDRSTHLCETTRLVIAK